MVWPRTLFDRTAVLITLALVLFAAISWSAVIWSTVIPTAQVTAHVLAGRAESAIASYRSGQPLPEDVTLASTLPQRGTRNLLTSLRSAYLFTVRRQLLVELPGAQVLVARSVSPLEVWILSPKLPDRWLVLTWRVSRLGAPVVMTVVVLSGAVLVLVGAAFFAKKLTAPLADLASATRRIAEGERVAIDSSRGPSEVRALAAAFESMAHRLAEHEERRELMLAGLSHDLRSPLARLRVAVELLDGCEAGLVEQMAAEIEDIDRMIGQFLHYVRAGYREMPVEACVDDVIRDGVSHYLDEDELRLELAAGEPRLLPVESIQHLLSNLIDNAFAHGKPPVTVRTRLAPAALHLSVEDRGEGLTREQWREAIQPFRQLRAAPGTGHTGLGLALVQRLVEASGGRLSSDRTSEGTFRVEVVLPIESPPAHIPSAPG